MPVHAGPLFDRVERTALGAEIRALLLDEPEIVDRALNPPSAYEEAVRNDIDLLTQLSARLFDPAQDGFGPDTATLRIALFLRRDCAACGQAQEDLRNLAQVHDLRVTLFAMDDAGDGAALATRLGLSDAPSYVLPDMMLQGHMPPLVLERYLTR